MVGYITSRYIDRDGKQSPRAIDHSHATLLGVEVANHLHDLNLCVCLPRIDVLPILHCILQQFAWGGCPEGRREEER